MSIRANNNRKNKQGLLDYQKRQLKLANITEEEIKKARIQSNIELWNEFVPKQYKNINPANLHVNTIEKIKKAALKPPYDKFVMINAKDATVAMYVSYAITHALLKQGILGPANIQTTSIMDGYSNIHGMFSSRYWKDNFFNKNGQLLLINGISKSLTNLGNKGEDQFWRELIEHCRNNDRLAIMTYIMDNEEYKSNVFIPSITSTRDVNSYLIKKSVFIKLTDEEEEIIKNEQRKFFESL